MTALADMQLVFDHGKTHRVSAELQMKASAIRLIKLQSSEKRLICFHRIVTKRVKRQIIRIKALINNTLFVFLLEIYI